MKKYIALFFVICLSSCSIKEQISEDYFDKDEQTEHFLSTSILSSVALYETGDVRISDANLVVKDGVVSSSFEVEAPVDGEYFLSVFMLPEDESEYHIECNGKPAEGVLRPHIKGWQAIRFTDNQDKVCQIPMKKGSNIVSVFSSCNDYPEIRIFKMALSESNSEVLSTEYDDYIEKIRSGELKSNKSIGSATKALSPTSPINYQYQLNCPVLYSFTKTIVLSAGNNNVTVSTMSVLADTVIVDVFKDNIYTWKGLLVGPGSVTQNFPPGVYTVHLRCLPQATPFLAPISISYTGNINYNYSVVPISGFSFVTQSDGYNAGPVNYFTCKTSSGANPIMYLENAYGGTAIGSTNDDYSGTGDFDWTVNPRIITGYSSAPLVHIFNASADIPEGTCDLYVRMPYASYSSSDFPYLKQNDAIHTGAATSDYNCISWAGDITYTWVWPIDDQSPYYIPGASSLDMFDNYFSSRGYTRSGATADNAGVALWGNNYGFTHASICKNSVSIYPHGYDWESKTGHLSRFFHEKNSLRGSLSSPASYGEIKYYYRPTPASIQNNSSFESISLTERSLSILREELLNTRGEKVQTDYDYLFRKWEEYCETPEVLIQSSSGCLKNDDSYTNLVAYCAKYNRESLLFTIQRLEKGDPKTGLLAGLLLNDIFPERFSYLKKEAYHRYVPGMEVIPTAEGNIIRLAEAYLRATEEGDI